MQKGGGQVLFAEKKSMVMDHRPQMTDRILLKHETLEVQWDPMLMSCSFHPVCLEALSTARYEGF